jgi:hypothetical protein
MMMTVSKREKCILLLTNAVFYLLFPIMDGPVICRDSNSYITMDTSREPLYPLFLALLRKIFGEGTVTRYGQPVCLFAAVLLQSVLAAAAVSFLAAALMSGARSRRRKMLAAAAAVLPQWGVTLLNRFAAQRGSCYTECIMTEGLGISFFILFVAVLYLYERDGRIRDLVSSGVLIFLCVSLRKQLLVTALTAAAVLLLISLPRALHRKKRNIPDEPADAAGTWPGIAAMALTIVLALGAASLLDHAYNYARYGVWAAHTGNYMGIDCVLIYTSEEKDAGLFSDPEMRSLFEEIRQQASERRLLYDDAGEKADWVTLTEHFSESYDEIGYNVMNPVLIRQLDAQPAAAGLNKLQYYMALDRMEKTLRDALLRQDPGKFLNLWKQNFRRGLVTTAAREGKLLNAVSLCLYSLYAALLILLGASCRRETAAGSLPEDPDDGKRKYAVFLFSLTVIFAILINAAVVGAVIFPQTRYMIYGMGLFYSALLCMAAAILPAAR